MTEQRSRSSRQGTIHLEGDYAADAHAKMNMAQLVAQSCASHSEPQGVAAMLMAKLEGDNTNVQFLNCSQGRDALRAVTKSIAAKGMTSYDLPALRKELVELSDGSALAEESCSVAIENAVQGLQERNNETRGAASLSLRLAQGRYGRARVAGCWQTPLAKNLRASALHHAPHEEAGASSRRRADQQRQLGRTVSNASGPDGFGLDDLEEDASIAEKLTGPLFDTADTPPRWTLHTVTLWTANHSVPQMVEPATVA